MDRSKNSQQILAVVSVIATERNINKLSRKASHKKLLMNLFVRGYTLCVVGTVIAAMISILLSAEGYMRS